MKIFIIGGTGHVGSYMVPELVKQGDEVYLGTKGNTKVSRRCAQSRVKTERLSLRQ